MQFAISLLGIECGILSGACACCFVCTGCSTICAWLAGTACAPLPRFRCGGLRLSSGHVVVPLAVAGPCCILLLPPCDAAHPLLPLPTTHLAAAAPPPPIFVPAASWDPRREGTLLGWTEFQANLPLLLDRFRRNSD